MVRKFSYPCRFPFSQDAVCRTWSEWGVPAGLVLATRNCRGGKVVFPLPFRVSAWLRPLSFSVPCEWTSLSRLKALLCGRCNSRLSLVRLIYLFSLKTKLYLPEASHCTQPRLRQTQSNSGQFLEKEMLK